MPAKIAPKGTRRKVQARGIVTQIPNGQGNRFNVLSNLSRRELRDLAKAAGLPSGGDKLKLATELAADASVSISVTTEAVVFNRPPSKA